MPATIKTISPFYNDDSSAPPPFPPMLTDQLELFGKTHHSSSLLADEVLPPSYNTPASVPEVKSPSRTQGPTLAPKFRLAARSPYPKKEVKQTRAISHSTNSDSEESQVSTSDNESTASSDSEDSKIPKPPGEPGRPGRGGYTLETALGWNQKSYSKFKNFMHSLIDEHLDVTKCASAQNTTLLKLVRDKAADKFPDLDNYSNCWPVNDIIMMRLKYTSSRTRRQEVEMVAGKSKRSKSSNVTLSSIPQTLTDTSADARTQRLHKVCNGGISGPHIDNRSPQPSTNSHHHRITSEVAVITTQQRVSSETTVSFEEYTKTIGKNPGRDSQQQEISPPFEMVQCNGWAWSLDVVWTAKMSTTCI
ncbi:hypothetical protein HYDPIDRAFT_167379 [Hydnomerulius pinastri MD-312]|uniref:Uncharacterized protein n=1 Tax=Hydnomerulius pinastri MD-312 TaxID=994086 RepID=A0A0C9WAQ1_9AGAM|nr:hypothetical protein HYDPIDRAFT_167379 [Hydnomerulius pinastri MD-312]